VAVTNPYSEAVVPEVEKSFGARLKDSASGAVMVLSTLLSVLLRTGPSFEALTVARVDDGRAASATTVEEAPKVTLMLIRRPPSLVAVMLRDA